MPDLGKKIRAERLNQGFTLDQLAKKANLSKSFLSQIERGTGRPSIESLKKIAMALGVSVVKFFRNPDQNQTRPSNEMRFQSDGPQRHPYTNEVEIVRSGRRKRLALPGSKIIYELLSPNMQRSLEVIYMHIAPGEQSGDKAIVDPVGDKFGVILKGSLEIRIDEQAYILKAGDTIYFPANLPHSWRGMEGEESIEAIWVFNPPCF